MQYLDTLFFYTFSCSTLLVYGIGLEKTFFESRPGSHFFARLPAILLETILSVSALWYIITLLLLPNDFGFLIPMATILVCAIFQILTQVLFPSARKIPSGEQLFFYGTVFLALAEAGSLPEALIIVAASLVSFSLITILLFAIRQRIASSNAHTDWKGTPLILVSMGLLCIALYSTDVSWWLVEVFR